MTDKQFLTGMWNKVDALADVERQNQLAAQRSKALQRRAVLRAALIAAGALVLMALFFLLPGLVEAAGLGRAFFLPLLGVLIAFSLALFADSRTPKGEHHG